MIVIWNPLEIKSDTTESEERDVMFIQSTLAHGEGISIVGKAV